MTTITLDGKTYKVEVRKGVRYVDGKTVDQFIDGLIASGEFAAVTDLVTLGASAVNGNLPAGSPQVAANCLRAGRVKNN